MPTDGKSRSIGKRAAIAQKERQIVATENATFSAVPAAVAAGPARVAILTVRIGGNDRLGRLK